MHYTIPLFTPVPDGFRFPSIYVGQYGVYDAIKHLFKNDPQNLNHVFEDWLWLSKDWFCDQLEKSVLWTRTRFRSARGIEDDDCLIFVNPGNTEKEVLFTYE